MSAVTCPSHCSQIPIDSGVRSSLRSRTRIGPHGAVLRIEVKLAPRSGGHFDAVVLDMMMPEMGGLETLREVRRLDPQYALLQKPHAHAELTARVTELMALRQARTA